MSIAPTARVTGTVVETLVQSGNKNGRDWSIRTARVLVGKADLCEVQLSDSHPSPADGTAVDWRVRLGNPGGYLRVTLVGDWPSASRSVKAAG